MLNFKKKILAIENIQHHKKQNYDCAYRVEYQSLMEQLLTNPDYFLATARNYYKNNERDTTTVGHVEVDGHQIILKRYNHRNLMHGIKLQFRQSHAFRSFWYAYQLGKLGIKTIKPIAVIQRKKLCFKQEAFFVSEFIPGIKGCEYFKDESFEQEWGIIAQDIKDLVQQLQHHRIYHGDFHFGNLVIADNKVYLLDFDRIKQEINARKFAILHQKDRYNFRRYLDNHPKARKLFYWV